jgi:hypothetical protein
MKGHAMKDANVRFYRPATGERRTLHIETTGAVIDITVGLTDKAGQPTTRIDITPDGELRGGDAQGRVWDLWQNGTLDCDGVAAVVLRPDLRYNDAAIAAEAAAEAREGGVRHEYWSLVTTGDPDESDLELIAGLIEQGNTEGPYESDHADDRED